MALQSLALRFLLALASLLSAHGQEEFFNIQIVPQGTGKKWFFLLEDFAAFPPVSWMFIFTACSPGLEPRWTPGGWVSWGTHCLCPRNRSYNAVYPGVLWDRQDWAGCAVMGHTLQKTSLPIIPWREWA